MPGPSVITLAFGSHRYHFLLIAVLAILMLFTNLHKGGLSGLDDAIYAHEGKQMLLTGHWQTVIFNGFPVFEHPPMFVWMEALAFRVLGISDFAAKFPSALSGFGVILFTFLIARELSDQFWLPVLSMWIMLLSQYFLKYAMHAMTDVPFAFFFTAAIFFYLKGFKQPRFFIICGISIGCAILTRSVVGLIPIGIIMLHLALTGRYRLLSSWQFLALLVVAVAIPFIWYSSQFRIYGSEFLTKHFGFIESKVSPNVQGSGPHGSSFFFYCWQLLTAYEPWFPLMLIGFATQIREFLAKRDSTSTLLVVWVVCVLLPFSLATATVLRYILPAFPAFAILTSIPLTQLLSTKERSKYLALAYPLLIAVIVALAAFPRPLPRGEEMRVLAPIADAITQPSQRVVLYTYGEPRHDIGNQFIWYANHFAIHKLDLATVKESMLTGQGGALIMDKDTYKHGDLNLAVEVVGQSENFVCLKLKK